MKSEPNTPIKNVEKEFRRMIISLKLEDDAYLREIAIERKIRKELVELYKKVQKLEQQIETRNKLMIQCQGFMNDYPKRSLQLLDQIGELDLKIIPDAETLSKEIGQHLLPDIAAFYKEIDLTEQQTKQIRSLASMIHVSLTSVVGPISQAILGQQLESMRRGILSRNPGLRY